MKECRWLPELLWPFVIGGKRVESSRAYENLDYGLPFQHTPDSGDRIT